MKKLEDLKISPAPCPFCGGETHINLGHLKAGVVHYWVDCISADCMYRSAHYTDKDAAIAAHNRVARAVRIGEAVRLNDWRLMRSAQGLYQALVEIVETPPNNCHLCRYNHSECVENHICTLLANAKAALAECREHEGEIMHFSCYRIQAREDAGHGWANVLIDYETFEDAQKAFDKFNVKGEKRIVRVCEDVCCHSEQPISQLAPGGAEKSSND